MPKGKKKGKKKSGKKSGKSEITEKSQNNSDHEDDIFEDKEEQLKAKLIKIVQQIENTKSEIESLKEENKALEKDCDKVRSETEAFTNYLNDREEQRKNNLVTLQDYHKSKMDYYSNLRIEIVKECKKKKKELQNIVDENERQIGDLEEEIESYNIDVDFHEEQLKEIKELEYQIRVIQTQQKDDFERIKTSLILNHEKLQQESNEKINDVARASYKEALDNLFKSFANIQSENERLKQDMLEKIKCNKLLNERKIKLLEENRKLKEELQYAEDFASFRQIRQEKPNQLEELKLYLANSN